VGQLLPHGGASSGGIPFGRTKQGRSRECRLTTARKRILRLRSLSQLQLRYVLAELVTYRGRPAVRLVESGRNPSDDQAVAIPSSVALRDGVIETSLAGVPRLDAPQDARGFVGIAFRVQPDASKFECLFLRPTNSRSDDQLRRNHSTQYMSHPDYPWFRLRSEQPGMYESYVDLEPGAWTNIKIVVSGTRALLYVNRARQPCLVVNDLKLGSAVGKVGFWIGGGTEAYFSTRLAIQQTNGVD